MAKKKSRNNFMLHGAILGVSSILVRVIGLIYRIPLINILGEKGNAYYSIAFDVYSILLLLSSYSLPLAVSKMVSARNAKNQFKNLKRVFFMAISFSILVGLIAFCITFFGADFFAKINDCPQCVIALRVLSPALVILSVLGVLRGFFQGFGTMIPTAVSNILEQIVNAVVSLVAASPLFKQGQLISESQYGFTNIPEAYGAAGGTLGTVMGALFAMLFMIFLFMTFRKRLNTLARNDRGHRKESFGRILKILVATVVPVILSTLIYNIGALLDTVVFRNIMGTLDYAKDSIDVMTGMYSGNYRILINVPVALASALASSLIPSIVRSRTLGNRGEVINKIESAIKVTMVVAMPCAVGIGVLGKPIVNMLFSHSVDPDKVALMYAIGCISVVFYSLSTITNSILQGIDKMNVPVLHSAISLLIHLAFLAGMLFILRIDIFSVVIADLIFSLLMCILNQRSLKRFLNFRQDLLNTYFKPAICSVLMGIIVLVVNKLLIKVIHSNTVCVLLCIIIAFVVYFLALVFFRTVGEDELAMIPGGGRVTRLLRKIRLIR
ncbi:MAG: polysaccharide biosynthesis protein [Lachnospiraceae bacterium]|nr:polysaccharide biosynthesis protein [Lachnospiraceae bacterium]